MHLQMITPTAIDWDNDGDIDLIVGDEDGRVALVENVSPENASTPVFHQPVYFKQQADTLKFGALATPFAHDWDNDGDEDILCGNTAGNIALFTNLDGKGTRWSAPELLEADGREFRILAGESGSIQGPAEAKWGYTTLSVADWDADGRDDILVNSIWPKLQLLRNTEAGLTEQPLPFWTKEAPPSFYWWQTWPKISRPSGAPPRSPSISTPTENSISSSSTRRATSPAKAAPAKKPASFSTKITTRSASTHRPPAAPAG